jgi:hypothetical protein
VKSHRSDSICDPAPGDGGQPSRHGGSPACITPVGHLIFDACVTQPVRGAAECRSSGAEPLGPRPTPSSAFLDQRKKRRGPGPFAPIFSPFNLKKGDVVGSFCNIQYVRRRFPSGAAGDKALLYEIFCCQTPMAQATHAHENGWLPAAGSTTRIRGPFTLFSFQRSVKHYRRHLTMRNGLLSVLHLEFYSRGKERSGDCRRDQSFQSRPIIPRA